MAKVYTFTVTPTIEVTVRENDHDRELSLDDAAEIALEMAWSSNDPLDAEWYMESSDAEHIATVDDGVPLDLDDEEEDDG